MLRRFRVWRAPRRRNHSTAMDEWFNRDTTERIQLSNSILNLRTGHMARFAGGAITASIDNSTILATVVSQSSATTTGLSVDFLQSGSAVGRIPMNYLRRELQQSDMDILISRMIDRSLRPLITEELPIKVVCKPLSLNKHADAAVLGINAAAAAMALSEVPMIADVAACRIAVIDGEVVLNPSKVDLRQCSMDLLLSGTNKSKVLMMEMEGAQIEVDKFVEGIEKGLTEVEKILKGINSLRLKAGAEKLTMGAPEDNNEIIEEVMNSSRDRLIHIFTDPTHLKESRDRAISNLKAEVVEFLSSVAPKPELETAFNTVVKCVMRSEYRREGRRVDGRALDEVRPIRIQTDLYPNLHGSAIFQRGQSQVMGTVTFDSLSAAFRPDAIAQLLGAQEKKTFMVHYEFPQFAVNQISESSSRINRRSLGHGMLAEKALRSVVPTDFEYCLRLDCQVLESNGSTSMASACAGSLALFDAGVPIKAAIAGIAMGMISDEGESYRPKDFKPSEPIILTDLMGMEDYAGDMDFKVAGSASGLTALQLDMKVPGITVDFVRKTLGKARSALDHVLGLMNTVLPAPRPHFKESVPVMETLPLNGYEQSIIFRSGGYNAKLITAETGVQVLREADDKILLMSSSREDLNAAQKMITDLVTERPDIELPFGSIQKAEIVEIKDKGVLVKLQNIKQPVFMKLSSLSLRKVIHTSALDLKVGQTIIVKYFGRDPHSGALRLSKKDL